MQSNIFQASKHINDLTGYTGIESLKRTIEAQETTAQLTRAAVRAAKDAYTRAIAQRSASQREVNELLQRKHAWSAADLERFTALYRSDHANEQAETRAAEALAAAERAAEEAAALLSKSILARYHEEQIWSDKIRRMSTWGTWGLMGVNVLLFVVFQVAVEPWRRRRLVKGFEEKVQEAIERERAGPVGLVSSLASDSSPVDTVSEHMPEVADDAVLPADTVSTIPEPFKEEPVIQTPFVPTAPAEPLSELPSSLVQPYKDYIHSLFSDQQIALRRVDVTAIALEGVAAGATFATVVCIVLLKRT